MTEVVLHVYDGDMNDARARFLKNNHKHQATPLSKMDKERQVVELLKVFPNQREIHRQTGLSPTTVGAIAKRNGIVLPSVRQTKKGPMNVSKIGHKPKQKRGDHRCYTPMPIIESVRQLCRALGIKDGQIPLDAASDEIANGGIPNKYEGIKARRYITEAMNGLTTPWTNEDGSPVKFVWNNPPFRAIDGKGLCGEFIEAAERNYDEGNVKNVVMLLPLRTTHAWSRMLSKRWTICQIGDPVKFLRPTGDAMQPAMHMTPMEFLIAYLGPNEGKFIDAFTPWGDIIPAKTVIPRNMLSLVQEAA
jgi:hypothetical protein